MPMPSKPAIASIPTATRACCIRSKNEEGPMAASARLGRIVFQNTQERSQEISVDLIFVGPQPKGGMEYYGLWQDRHEDVRCPFTLSPDGHVDFGTGYDEADRYYDCLLYTSDAADEEDRVD